MIHSESYSSGRLGSAEVAILSELRRAGEPVPRQVLLLLIQAKMAPPTPAASSASQHSVAQLLLSGRARQNAESTLSRALRSLERKGLIDRSGSESPRRSLISIASRLTGRRRERNSAADEAFAARCDAVSAELLELADKARRRSFIHEVPGVKQPRGH